MHKRKLVVREKERIEIGCPISGIPAPSISWLVKGSLLAPDQVNRGVKLGPTGETVKKFINLYMSIILAYY